MSATGEAAGEAPEFDPHATLACPLCASKSACSWHRDERRSYARCPDCRLIFVPAAHHLSPEREKAEYDRHRNSPDDPGYRRFLGRLLDPLHDLLAPGSQGLDFGSGPGPTLSLMLEELGHRMAIYDPFYAPDRSVLDRRYDFATATEVVEHLRRPRESLATLWQCVKPGGALGLMTKLARDRQAFARWHYIRDPTHIAFFSRDTFGWLAAGWRAAVTFIGPDVVLLHKPAP